MQIALTRRLYPGIQNIFAESLDPHWWWIQSVTILLPSQGSDFALMYLSELPSRTNFQRQGHYYPYKSRTNIKQTQVKLYSSCLRSNISLGNCNRWRRWSDLALPKTITTKDCLFQHALSAKYRRRPCLHKDNLIAARNNAILTH